ncbi:hypothetical protein FQN57_001467 [Myotisia sp. PD_48]|nr:hypothetical protein FQN57_001467 [Myotisia sp. PD_48]
MSDTSPLPCNYGVVLFPAFQALDAFGPLDALNLLSLQKNLNLYIIAETMNPVSTLVDSPESNQISPTFSQSVVPTHTFDTAPPLDVLLVPGGFGTRAGNLEPLLAFIRRIYPSLKYILSVCTGSILLARSGILDGRSATSNKRAWKDVVKSSALVKWVPEARWVIDGNVWTSSGVTAGIDLIFAFISTVYGEDVATMIATRLEYVRNKDPKNDPFAYLTKE